MQRAYFLGGSTSCGYRTAFWEQQKGKYGYYLKGGPGTGKSTLLKAVAAEFQDEAVSVYYCSSDPTSLDAVVLEERGVFVVDATAPHEQNVALPYVTGEQLDLAECLNGALIAENREEIQVLHQKNLLAHQRARGGIVTIEAMRNTICGMAKSALLSEKLLAYGARFSKRILPASKRPTVSAACYERQTAALTPEGWKTLVPDGYDTIVLDDSYGCAAAVLLECIAKDAITQGVAVEVTRSYIESSVPILHLVIPELKLMLLTVTAFASCAVTPTHTIRMQRFYRSDVLKADRKLLRFCMKHAESMLDYTKSQLAEALAIHDDLESYYISAQNRKKLNTKTNALLTALRKREGKAESPFVS